jgi:hypothetical protein
MLVALLMGFACGLPLLLTITVLQAWMKEQGVDNSSGRRFWIVLRSLFWAAEEAGFWWLRRP